MDTTKTNGKAPAARVVVRLGAAAEKACRAYAKREQCTVGEAADWLIEVGIRRLKALKKWGDAQTAEAPAKKKPAAKAKAKGKKNVVLKETPARSKADDSEE